MLSLIKEFWLDRFLKTSASFLLISGNVEMVSHLF